MTALIGTTLYFVAHLAAILRALTVDGRDAASRTAWVLILVFVPVIGILAYLIVGEPWVARRYLRQARLAAHPPAGPDADLALDTIPERFQAAFRVCEAIGRRATSLGNEAQLTPDSNGAIDWMIRDFDAAQDTIHVSFYIWLTDRNGLRIIDALQRAAQRGVTCRVVVDSLGSRPLIRSPHWAAMRAAGIHLCTSLKLSYGLGWLFGQRVDLRNHRKIVVIDDLITYCGSQNCADPEFRIKAKYAPWVDIMLRLRGPVAAQNQQLFAAGWQIETGEPLQPGPKASVAPADGGFPAIAFGTGPGLRRGAMSDVFVSLLYSARHEVVISTPYFVPDAPLLAALVSCARRGVATTLILPARNDSWVVSAISKAQYSILIEAGVRLLEFEGGLLHAKTLVVDQETALIGSANMDRRSLELNFENNILLHSPETVRALRQRQDAYQSSAREVIPASTARHRLLRKLVGNTATILGPIL